MSEVVPESTTADWMLNLAACIRDAEEEDPGDCYDAREIVKMLARRSAAAEARIAELEAGLRRPTSKEGRPMNRREGRMVQASELLREIEGIMEKWGDTCFYITGLAWGSVALWQQSDYDDRAAMSGATGDASDHSPVPQPLDVPATTASPPIAS